MLTDNEKQILGYMVDMGVLQGQRRVDAGADDEFARELITDFSTQMRITMPLQLGSLMQQRTELDDRIERTNLLLRLLE